MAELIHTCYRVLDLERSIVFYESLGMEELRRIPIRDEATNVFMGLPGDGARLELTYNHGRTEPYEIGTGYGHIAIAVDDLDGTLDRLARAGLELASLRVPKVDGELRLAGDGGRDSRAQRQRASRRHPAVVARDALDCECRPRRREPRVAAAIHRRRARVRG